MTRGKVPRSGGYFLFDGALLLDTPVHAELFAQPHAVKLYADLGESAAAVGPLLIPATSAVGALAQTLATGESAQRFASSRLICPRGIDVLAAHLHRLRYLHGQQIDSPRYYFRYADSRGFAALWNTLPPEQQTGVLGPVESWEWLDPSGRFIMARHAPNAAGDLLPLRLQPAQWNQLLEPARIGELLAMTMQAMPHLARRGLLGQHYAWTRSAYRWLHRHRFDEPALQVVVNAAVWQTDGAVIDQPVFEGFVRDAKRRDQIEDILQFSFGHDTTPDAW